MKWTKKKPRVDGGWYWMFDEEFSPVPEIVCVNIDPSGIYFDYGSDHYQLDSKSRKIEWAGPIPRPK